ncbi:MAG: CxxC-x17-CxxC domain-containing protein [Thermomicrobiales bacterium]
MPVPLPTSRARSPALSRIDRYAWVHASWTDGMFRTADKWRESSDGMTVAALESYAADPHGCPSAVEIACRFRAMVFATLLPSAWFRHRARTATDSEFKRIIERRRLSAASNRRHSAPLGVEDNQFGRLAPVSFFPSGASSMALTIRSSDSCSGVRHCMSRSLVDQTLACEDCGRTFTFSVAEQAFYAVRGFRAPARCVDCRGQRRAERNAELVASYESMAKTSDWHDVRSGFGGQRDRAVGYDRGRVNGSARRGGFRAVCAACGCDTELPFQPRGGRPVYCRECFSQRRGR